MEKSSLLSKKGIFSRFPDAVVIMVFLILLSGLLTFIIPAGEFDRVEDPNTGYTVAVAGTYHNVEQTPVGWMDLFLAIPNGLSSSAMVIIFVIMTAGSLGIINKTGAINALIGRTINKSGDGKNDKFVIAGIILLFGLLSATIGTFSEGLAFIPLIMVLVISLGYDALVATAVVMASVCAGYGAATINPFNVGLAQGISGLAFGSGLWFRWIFWIVTMSTLIWYVLRYAKRIKADPSKSLVKDIDYSDLQLPEKGSSVELTKTQILTIVLFFIGIVLLIFLMVTVQLSFFQISSYFLVLGVLIGFINRMHPNDIVASFMKGAENILYGALVVGVAWAISGLMSQGHILDSIVYYTSLPLQYLPDYISAGLMVLVQAVINLFIPSGSGQAMVTMPIIAPLCDVLGISRQVGVLAFQMGDGFANVLVPSLGVTMAAIAIGRIPYPVWLKFVSKLFLIQIVIGIIFCFIAVMIGL